MKLHNKINIPKLKTNYLNLQPIKMATISLYPNPTSDFFQITGIEDSAQLTISDLNCITLLKKEITIDEKISVSTLRKGVYVAKITTSSYTIERKLVKE